MPDMVMESWSPWVSGLLIGMMVPALYVVVGRRFGVSASLRHIGAICAPRAKSDYLRRHNWRDHKWNLVFISGLLVGSFAGAQFLTSSRLEILPEAANSVGGVVRLGFGGLLIGFGTRYAGGCTSGHTISGISNLNWPSFVATGAFFGGGLLSTWGLTFLIL